MSLSFLNRYLSVFRKENLRRKSICQKNPWTRRTSFYCHRFELVILKFFRFCLNQMFLERDRNISIRPCFLELFALKWTNHHRFLGIPIKIISPIFWTPTERNFQKKIQKHRNLTVDEPFITRVIPITLATFRTAQLYPIFFKNSSMFVFDTSFHMPLNTSWGLVRFLGCVFLRWCETITYAA